MKKNLTSSSSLLFSDGDFDNSSSISDIQVSRLQDEILQQSKGIEQFIKNTNTEDDNASLTVLKSLFTLFKSELSVNLALRKVLVEERKKAELSASKIQILIHKLHKEGFTGIKNLSEVYNTIKQQDSDIRILLHNEKVFKRAIKEEKKQIKKLVEYVGNMENEIAQKQENEDESAQAISSFTDKIDAANNEIAKLNQDVIAKRNKIIELEQVVNDLQMKVQEQEKANNELQKQFNADIEAEKTKSNESKMVYFQQLTNLTKEIDQLKQENAELQKKHETEVTDLHTQYITDMEQIKEELNGKADLIQKDKEKMEMSAKKIADNQQKAIDSIRHTLINKEKEIGDLKNEIISLNEKISHLESNKIDADISLSNFQKKTKKMNKVLKLTKNKFKDSCQNYEDEIKELKISYENKMKKEIENINESWQIKIEQIETNARELRSINEEQKAEICTLKDTIRKLSFNLQQEEADNARLHATLQIKKYKNSNFSPLSLHVRESPEKSRCSPRHIPEISNSYDSFTSTSISENE